MQERNLIFALGLKNESSAVETLKENYGLWDNRIKFSQKSLEN